MLVVMPCTAGRADGFAAALFGAAYPQLDRWVTGAWWTEPWNKPGPKGKPPQRPPFSLDVSRDEVVAFALYTVDVPPAGGAGVLKLTAQLFPLKPGEPRVARVELKRGDAWEEVATSEVLYPGWDEFGLQFRDLLRDRPAVTIPDDHDVGHPNLWGAGGRKAERSDGADGYGIARWEFTEPGVAGRCRARSPSSAGRGSRSRGPTASCGNTLAGRW